MKLLTLYPETEFANGKNYNLHWWSMSYTYYHRHSGFYELILTNTPLLHTVENQTMEIKEHTLILIPPMVYHKLTDTNKMSHINHFNLSVKIEYLNMFTNSQSLNMLFKNGAVPTMHLTDEEYAYFLSLAEKLIFHSSDERLSNEYLSLYLTSALSMLKIEALKNLTNETTHYAEQLKNELDNFQFIDKQIADFYKKFPIAPAELIADFKKLTGYTIVQYVTKQRIILACNLLANTHFSLQQITYKIGYNSVSHFIRVFKAEKGLTPSEYRASLLNA